MKFLFGIETFRNEVIDPGYNFECVSGSSAVQVMKRREGEDLGMGSHCI